MNTIIREAIRNVLSEAKENFEQKSNQLRKKGIQLSQDEFNWINSVDPTSNGVSAGKFFDWIISNRDTINKNYRDSIRTILTFFDKKKQLLSAKGQSVNIQDYTPEQIDSLVRQFEGKSLEFENALRKFSGDVQVVYKDNRYVVVHCDTWEAERFFGRGTEWCTVGNKAHFDRYNKDGLLFICIPIEGGRPNIDSEYKIQCSVNDGYFCVANIGDNCFHSFEEFYKRSIRRWQYDKPMIQYLNRLCDKFKVPSYEEGDIRQPVPDGLDKNAVLIYEYFDEKTRYVADISKLWYDSVRDFCDIENEEAANKIDNIISSLMYGGEVYLGDKNLYLVSDKEQLVDAYLSLYVDNLYYDIQDGYVEAESLKDFISQEGLRQLAQMHAEGILDFVKRNASKELSKEEVNAIMERNMTIDWKEATNNLSAIMDCIDTEAAAISFAEQTSILTMLDDRIEDGDYSECEKVGNKIIVRFEY